MGEEGGATGWARLDFVCETAQERRRRERATEVVEERGFVGRVDCRGTAHNWLVM